MGLGPKIRSGVKKSHERRELGGHWGKVQFAL